MIWEDFLRHFRYFYHANDARQVRISRALATGLGCVAVGIAYLSSSLDIVLEVSEAAIGSLAGPLLAVFLLGFFTSTTNKFVSFQLRKFFEKYNIFNIFRIFREQFWECLPVKESPFGFWWELF